MECYSSLYTFSETKGFQIRLSFEKQEGPAVTARIGPGRKRGKQQWNVGQWGSGEVG